MADDAFSLDSLLEDLDAVVSPPTTRFVPHPPAKDRLSSHNIISNPKTKFAVQPGSSQNSPEGADRGSLAEPHRNFGGNPKNTSAVASAPPDTDENSIDNLLNLINSPPPKVEKTLVPGKSYAPFSPTAPDHTDRYNSKATIFHNAEISFADRNRYVSSGMGGNDHSGPGARALQQVHTEDARIAEGSCFSSPFDSPSSHGSASTGALSSARKTHPMLPFARDGSFSSSSGAGSGALPSALTSAQHGQGKYGASSSGAGASGAFASSSSFGTGTSQLMPLEGTSSSVAGKAQGQQTQGSLFGRTTAVSAQSGGLQGIMSSNGGGAGGGGFGSSKDFGALDDGRDRFLPASINLTSSAAGGGGGGSSAAAAGAKARCARVVIAGSAVARGRKASSFASCACNNLRCLQCNFKVHCFAGSAWDASVDYMFLRNTVPNEGKLASKLLQSAASCAYCCQCSFASEAGERELQPQGARGDPQWICAGH